jgi:hypothetical protein
VSVNHNCSILFEQFKNFSSKKILPANTLLSFLLDKESKKWI